MNEHQKFMVDSFCDALDSVKQDFLSKALYELLSECDRHGIGISLFLDALNGAISQDKKSFEWHECTMNLQRASYAAYEAERIDNLTRQVLKGGMPR